MTTEDKYKATVKLAMDYITLVKDAWAQASSVQSEPLIAIYTPLTLLTERSYRRCH
jgi:hypothetical protein